MASRLVSDEEGKNYLVGSAIYWERELGIENKTNRDLVFNRIPNHNLVHIISTNTTCHLRRRQKHATRCVILLGDRRSDFAAPHS